MANFSISPGVTLNEIDNTFLLGQPVQAGAAIIGPTVKGPVEQPTLVTSYSDYQSIFGDTFVSGSGSYSFLTSISAYSYFNYGGESLLVTRVVSGSYTAATSSFIATGSGNLSGSGVNKYYTATSGGPFVLETIAKGVKQDNDNIVGSYYSDGLLPDGTKDNLRFEISNVSTSSGLFNITIRQGNDLQNKKIVLETWNKVNLDPESDRYIAKVIGDQTLTYDSTNEQNVTTGDYPNNSRYVRVKTVNSKMPTYLNSAGTANPSYVEKMPLAGNGTFGGGTGDIEGEALFYDNISSTNTQGLSGTDYDIAIKLMSDKDSYKYNVLFTPGLFNDTHTSQVTNIITNTVSRGDALYVPDMTLYASSLSEAITQAASRDTSYAATYWPWVKMLDPGTGKQVWIPASTVVPGVYAYNDKVAAPWFAPAGINRGGLNTVSYAKYKLTQANKDDLYEANINPLATISGEGVVVFGQKTLQKEASALDRVNVRRLLIELKSYIGQLADQIVFEQNTQTTRKNFLARVTPYLEGVQQKQGLYAFKVVMDESNNTPAVIDRNQLVGQIYIQPTRTAEFISLDFILMPTGAEFPS
jgi:phage tail sheath protein FI